MSNYCRRCYIEHHPSLKKKQIKQLLSTAEKYKCDGCGEYKALVIEPKKKENLEDDENY